MSLPTSAMPTAAASSARLIAVTSGKGGVGKTFASANLAAALAARGERVLLLDADLGLANLDVVLNVAPRVTLHDVIAGRRELDEAIVEAPGGFDWIVVHKGELERIPRGFLLALDTAAVPVFANEVFVVFATSPAADLDDGCLRYS